MPLEHSGECEKPAPMPVHPQVSTPPRPLVEKEEPKTASMRCLSPFSLAGEAAWNGEMVKLAIATPALAPLLAGKQGSIDLKVDSAPLTAPGRR